MKDARKTDWREQEARNETIFREFNEWTDEELGPESDSTIEHAFLCECSDRRCTDPIGLTLLEYEAVRSVPIRFAIALNHENPEIDIVIQENPRFATVDKIVGIPARVAQASDPRR